MTPLALSPKAQESRSHLLPCNFGPRPAGQKVDLIVIHVMAGTMEGTRAWFNNPASKVSAHYGISLAGAIENYVLEDLKAYHAGITWVRRNGGGWTLQNGGYPTFPLVASRPGLNPNAYSIGIEHEGTGRDPWPQEQVEASIRLVADIAFRHQFVGPLEAHVATHHDIYPGHACPGATCPFDAIVAGAQKVLDDRRSAQNVLDIPKR